MNIEHLSKHLIQEHIYNNLSSLCRFLFVASMRRSVWEARKAAAKCFLWKPCSVVRKYSTPGNVRHICLHPTFFSHFWDFSSTSRFLCWPYAFLPKCFSQFHVTVDANVELSGSIHPSHMSQARLPPSPWCEHLLMWIVSSIYNLPSLLHLNPHAP